MVGLKRDLYFKHRIFPIVICMPDEEGEQEGNCLFQICKRWSIVNHASRDPLHRYAHTIVKDNAPFGPYFSNLGTSVASDEAQHIRKKYTKYFSAGHSLEILLWRVWTMKAQSSMALLEIPYYIQLSLSLRAKQCK